MCVKMQLKKGSYDLDDLVKFVFSTYKATNGAYPLLEWVEKKPSIDDFATFEKIYKPFLKKRMEEEFDEFYFIEENELIGIVALVYKFKGKEIEWIPKRLKRKENGFIEFLLVSPVHQGKGYGKMLLEFAIKRLNELNKNAYVVTSKKLPAFNFYKKFGFVEYGDYNGFVILMYKGEKC